MVSKATKTVCFYCIIRVFEVGLNFENLDAFVLRACNGRALIFPPFIFLKLQLLASSTRTRHCTNEQFFERIHTLVH